MVIGVTEVRGEGVETDRLQTEPEPEEEEEEEEEEEVRGQSLVTLHGAPFLHIPAGLEGN
jgi:hypothetical protein